MTVNGNNEVWLIPTSKHVYDFRNPKIDKSKTTHTGILKEEEKKVLLFFFH